MATRADFTAEEWTTIFQSPVMAGMVVMTAGKSGPIQMAKEMFAVGKTLSEADKQGSANGLISAIVAAIKANERPEAPAQAKTIEEARNNALEHLRRTAAIVDSKATTDAPEFKRWLAAIGKNVAEAATEGGFLGFGGTQVTDEERAAERELAAALGISAVQLGGTA
jgi:hypothetical protein